MTDPTSEFDIIIFGATSFVGQIVTRYMHAHCAGSPLRWAIAARSPDKLQSVSKAIGLGDVAMLVADAQDEPALRAMCARTKTVISTVGPYALYGDTLVKVCAGTGTHYCDLTGEPQWIRKMQDAHEATARKSGARIVHCCGFDSIPSDLGVHFLQRHARATSGASCENIAMRVMRIKGGASGGTVASMIAMVKQASKDAELRRELKNPYSLCPPDHAYTVRQRSIGTDYDARLERWIAPFIMAAINTRVVHRSNALSGNAYGTRFQYEEAMVTGRGAKGKRRSWMIQCGMLALVTGLALPPMRWLLEKTVLPKPGEGPSAEEQRAGMFDMLFLGSTATGETISCRVTGDRDPGYGSTAKMLSQAAICLTQDVPDHVPGGFWTPATLLGDRLIDRLESAAGLTFVIEDA